MSVRQLDKSVAALELELAANRAMRVQSRLSSVNGTSKLATETSNQPFRKRAFVVVGINTAFSSKKRRDSVRETWMPTGVDDCRNF